ncbi:hypothetical protein B0H13DRAFT_684455 [Mycena leptocephala]|nr:hypothetical protein B0H13DRAFT_684455 [Mycena leptocephala]
MVESCTSSTRTRIVRRRRAWAFKFPFLTPLPNWAVPLSPLGVFYPPHAPRSDLAIQINPRPLGVACGIYMVQRILRSKPFANYRLRPPVRPRVLSSFNVVYVLLFFVSDAIQFIISAKESKVRQKDASKVAVAKCATHAHRNDRPGVGERYARRASAVEGACAVGTKTIRGVAGSKGLQVVICGEPETIRYPRSSEMKWKHPPYQIASVNLLYS